MRKFLFIVLYTALGLGANSASAFDRAEVEALREGDMRKLVFLADPADPVDVPYITAEGEGTLADYQGKYVVLNFWALWCAPCREEMPTLSNLQAELGGDDFSVVTMASGRNALPGIHSFFEEIGVDNLPDHRDPKQALSRAMSVLGLPLTVVLDPQGREIARLRGDAVWDSDSALAIMSTLLDRPKDTVN